MAVNGVSGEFSNLVCSLIIMNGFTGWLVSLFRRQTLSGRRREKYRSRRATG
jgi:hypothetical protein